ncbi:FAD-binding oxidoreductase [Conexibacter sp. JD483]|uniref:FAD-binding oxidoreductase n=1 Tax=unclassified Conexibacter TaxID=2627773 RepID=UPI0027175E21|nr:MULTISPECIES: FAD-binding oxidoreductase [unclassified Conexibacter]MDO8186234.1 FAD-binding oxidoreductase [Conexibacter sp. CPCC 205706]MDO8199699.1 FAD-binding oxidoreductase [Conexibacter sp. CPCC 205762]MDR9368209.1 FAD-binding oxidoreductase [Conexibacter sp. JD483]
MARERNHWGWGWEDEALPPEQLRAAAAGMAQHLGFGDPQPEPAVALAAVVLSDPRVRAPANARPGLWADDLPARVRHTYGRAYRDVVRAFRGRFDHPPDLVARPRDEREVEQVLEWAAGANVAVIPFGGGTSVVGGVEARVGDGFAGAVSLDLTGLDRLLEVDPVSRAARFQAGVLGPALEAQLAPHGLTLRHYPQSFQFSTLGGWIVTRAGGHFATGPTHIDDLVESVRAIAPAGTWESRRLPGSGAGPSPDRLLFGSEGTLGVVTEAWVRLRPKPLHRAGRAVRFASFTAGAAALRALAQSGLQPENCRLIDAREAALTFAGDGSATLLVLGFESAHEPVDARLESALALCREAGGSWDERPEGARGGAVGSWREAFLRAPYVRDVLVSIGVLSETFETAITWERFDGFVAAVRAAVGAKVDELCGGGLVSCRVTHVYPDGAAPYFTVVAPVRRGAELETWDAIKQVAGDAIDAAGGTITHHHAVGRDHRPWYDRQRPEPFAVALRGAKAAVDPAGILNPGVLLPVAPRAADL